MGLFRDKTLLIVDDEVDLREILRDEFQVQGCKVLEAENGRKAWELLCSNPSVDLVLSDIRMPHGDGISLLKLIRERHSQRPIVFLMTGFADVDEEEARRLGALGVFQKPFSLAQMVRRIQEALMS